MRRTLRARLRRHDKRHVEGPGERAETRVKPRRMWGAGEKEPGEVVMVLPLVEEGVQEHFGGDDLLTHCRPVIDADASGRDRTLGECAAVVAVRLALQTLSVVRVHLGSICDDQIAMGEARERIELIDEELPKTFTLSSVIRRIDDAQRQPSCDWARLHGEPSGALAPPVRGVWTSTEHLLREYTAAQESWAGTVRSRPAGTPTHRIPDAGLAKWQTRRS